MLIRNIFHMLFKMKNEEKKEIVLKGNLYKGLLILSLPIMFNNLMKTLYNLVDTYWVTQIKIGSDLEAGAVGIVFPVLMFFVAFGFGIQIAGTALMSQHIGSGNKEKADKFASQLMLFTIILGIAMMVVGIITAPYILRFMGLEDESFNIGSVYVRIMFIAIPFDFTLMAFTAMRQSYGDTLTPVIFTVISVVLNLILDPIFILVLGWGVEGAAIATVLSKLVIVPVWAFVAFHDKNSIHITLSNMRLNSRVIWKIAKVMFPASLGQAFNSVGFIVLNSFIIDYGDLTQSAFVIGNRIMNIIMMPAMGIGSSLAFYVGQNIGNNNYQRAKKAFYTSVKMTLLLMITGSIIMSVPAVRYFLTTIFLQEDKTIKLAVEYMLFVAFSIPLMGLYQNFNGVFQGSGRTIYTLALAITRLWGIRIPMIYILKNYTDVGSTGIWFAMVFSNVIVCLLGLFFYKFGRWERKLV